ncbi:MAG TPA: pyridoxal-phosphate dependent enzyme, partial [Holophaga sp.]|nr:pyridoxal-phosphate dependent enzyme [Holophaga sp.]
GILRESVELLGEARSFDGQDLSFLDGYAGRGYALSRPEEIDSIRFVARTEGIVLDPVYSGKAMHGLISEIRKGTFRAGQRILFIHTGGLFGVFHFLAGGATVSNGVK